MTEENSKVPASAPAMKVKLRPIGVSRDAPLSEDLLGRGPLLEKLGQFVRRVESPYVLAVDAPWGSGKSKLLEMWEVTLEAGGVPVVRFNAWESDFAADPLGPMLAALRRRFPEAAEPLLKRGKRVLRTYALAALPSVLKAATLGALDITATESRLEDAEAALGDAIEKVAERSVEAFDTQRDQVGAFRELLAGIALKQGGSERRVVMMIDELDRCRPSFAVELLERVKHVLEVEGFVFVFALDRAQLAHSVQAVYGSAFDGGGYLGRFFDAAFRLPPCDRKAFAEAVLLSRLGWKHVVGARGTEPERVATVEYFQALCGYLELSLREIEQCAGRLASLIYTVPANNRLEPVTQALFAILAQARRDLYLELVSSPEGADRVLTELNFEGRAEGAENWGWMTDVTAVLLATPVELFRTSSHRIERYQRLLGGAGGDGAYGDLPAVRGEIAPPDGFAAEVLNAVGRLGSGRSLGVRRAVDALGFLRDFEFGDNPASAVPAAQSSGG